MAKKHRDILNMQFDMLLKTKQYNELNPTNPNTRKASKEVCVNPRTGQKYIVVGEALTLKRNNYVSRNT